MDSEFQMAGAISHSDLIHRRHPLLSHESRSSIGLLHLTCEI